MRNLVLIVGLLCCAQGLNAQSRPRVLLAIFAHPDDEGVVGPVLARYAREGVQVYLAIATKGEKGAFPHSGIPAGERLAKVRREEAICACRELGINPPIFFDLNDGEVGAITRPPAQNVQAVADKFKNVLTELNPDAIVTFGPDGGYGHPDHRLVSAAVTQVVQSMAAPIRLFYVGFSTDEVKLLDELDPGVQWHPTTSTYLPVQISITKADQMSALHSLECHKSQFSPEDMKKLATVVNGRPIVWFRPWFSDRSRMIFLSSPKQITTARIYFATVPLWPANKKLTIKPMTSGLLVTREKALEKCRGMPHHRRRIATTIYQGRSPTPRTMSLNRASTRNGSNMASTFRLTMHGS